MYIIFPDRLFVLWQERAQNVVRKASFVCICQHPSGLSVTSYTSKQTRRDWLFGGRWNGSDCGLVVFLMVVCVCVQVCQCVWIVMWLLNWNCSLIQPIAAASLYYDSWSEHTAFLWKFIGSSLARVLFSSSLLLTAWHIGKFLIFDPFLNNMWFTNVEAFKVVCNFNIF